MKKESVDENSSSSSEEDEYGYQLTEELEKNFFKTLSSLKKKDPSIYDNSTKFFDNATMKIQKPKKKVTEKPLFIHDYEMKKILIDGGNRSDEDSFCKNDNQLSVSEEQQQLKDSFKKFLDESDESDEESGGLLKKHVKTKEEVQKEEADYIQWLKGQKEELIDKDTEHHLKPLHEFWNKDKLDKGEEFLRDYILNKRFLECDQSQEEEENNIESDDSKELEEMEVFEHKFNLRFEEESNTQDLIKRYPRTIERSLRRKNDKRKRKREEIKERKKIEEKKKRDEINRQKNIKLREIEERLEKLKELTGNEKLAFNDDDIMEDFNAEAFDKKMSSMYNDEFYSIDDNVKPTIDNIEGLDCYPDGSFDENNMDCDAPLTREKKQTRTKKKKEKKKSFTEFSTGNNPSYNPELHESYQKFMDEYYQLDCEDFIEDMPCRFKYKNVIPNDFGLTIEEILCADDKELNKWSSAKKLFKIRADHVEKNEAQIYRRKGADENLKKKVLPSLFISDEVEVNNSEESQKTSTEKLDRKRKFPKNHNKKHKNKNHNFNDARLSAYGINPKKFKIKT